MNILISGGTFNKGGVETIIMNIIRNIDRKKYKFDIIAIRDNNEKGVFDDELDSYGIHLYKISSIKKQGVSEYLKEIKKIINNKKYDVIHINAVFGGILTLYCAYKYKIKKRIYHSHNTHDSIFDKKIIKNFSFLIKPFLMFLINWWSNEKVACGKAAGIYVFGKKAIEKNKVTILYNSIDLNKYCIISKEKHNDYKFSLGYSTRDIVLGNAARFTKVKNQIFLIKIIENLNKNCEDGIRYVLRLAGDGSEFDNCLKYVKDRHLENFVELLGNINNMDLFYKSLDIFVLPSLYEGFPVTAIESQLCGVPILMSDTITEEADLNMGIAKFLKLDDIFSWINEIKNINGKRLNDVTIEYQENSKIFSLMNLINTIERIYNE